MRQNTLPRTLALVFAITFAMSASTVATADSCSCSAPDGSCEASIGCSGGCTAICGNGDHCSASCSGHFQLLGTDVSLEMKNGTYSQLVNELARISGHEITLSPIRPNMVFNLSFKRAVLWDVLKILSEQGTVQIAGHDFSKLNRLRIGLLTGEKFSFCIRNTPVTTFVNDMAGLTGSHLRITSGRPMATINLKLQEATLNDVLLAVSDQTGTKITQDGLTEAQER